MYNKLKLKKHATTYIVYTNDDDEICFFLIQNLDFE